MTTLQIIWAGIIALSIVAYTVLAGIDLGQGFYFSLARNDSERRQLFGGIGPFWDGNQVWLIGIGGLLFTVFPPVYAAVFSSLYLPVMLTLFALIVRAVAIDFGLRGTDERQRAGWGYAVATSSLVAVALFGILLGHVLRGLTLEPNGVFAPVTRESLHPFALLTGASSLALLALYGAVYLAWKADGELQARAVRWARGAWTFLVLLLLATLIIAVVSYPHLTRNYRSVPGLWVLPALGLAAVASVALWNALGWRKTAYYSAVIAIVLLLGSVVVALFPILIPVRDNPAQSVTIATAAAAPTALRVMLIITCITLPVVILGFIWIYRLFGGKISAEAHY